MDFGPLIQALASKASITDLMIVGIVGVLIYLLAEERKERRAATQQIVEAINKFADGFDKVGTLLTELRITVAKGDK